MTTATITIIKELENEFKELRSILQRVSDITTRAEGTTVFKGAASVETKLAKVISDLRPLFNQ